MNIALWVLQILFAALFMLHAVLLDIVIAKQAAVVTTAELAGALPGRSS